MTITSVWRWLILFGSLCLIIILPFLIWEQSIERFVTFILAREAGAFVFSAIVIAALGADIFLPVPSSIVAAFAGATLGWFWATLVCWMGMTAGCAIGYWTGCAGGTPLVRRLVGEREYQRAVNQSGRLALPTLVVMRAVPVLAEVSVLAAGIARIPFRRFLFATGFANFGISAVYGVAGGAAKTEGTFLFVFGAALLVPLVGLVALKALAGVKVIRIQKTDSDR